MLNRQPDFKLFRWAAGAMHNKALHQSDGGLANFGNRRSSRRLVNADVRRSIECCTYGRVAEKIDCSFPRSAAGCLRTRLYSVHCVLRITPAMSWRT